MIRGLVTGVADGAIVGWLPADVAEEHRELQILIAGEAPLPGGDGRAPGRRPPLVLAAASRSPQRRPHPPDRREAGGPERGPAGRADHLRRRPLRRQGRPCRRAAGPSAAPSGRRGGAVDALDGRRLGALAERAAAAPGGRGLAGQPPDRLRGRRPGLRRPPRSGRPRLRDRPRRALTARAASGRPPRQGVGRTPAGGRADRRPLSRGRSAWRLGLSRGQGLDGAPGVVAVRAPRLRRPAE